MNTIYTIGYEGLDVNAFFDKLNEANILILADIRNNPNSRKKGFSKKRLMEKCERAGIEYIHLSELGIKSKIRKEFAESKEEIFQYYKDIVLPATYEEQDELIKLILNSGPIALMCFEKLPEDCHRSYLGKKLLEKKILKGWKIKDL